MNFISGFYTKVNYAQDLQDNSIFGKAEAAADVCRAPRRWIAMELGFSRKTPKFYIEQNSINKSLIAAPKAKGLKRVVRLIMGLALFIPGEIVGSALMASAYLCKEIRLKHDFSVRPLSSRDNAKLKELIQERTRLQKERQGCEPISCMLLTVVCLLCFLVFAAK
jgi:hypothetical protein